MRARFIAAIHSKNKIRVKFLSKEDQTELVRVCAPMDFGPSRRAADKNDRFHMWDFESDTKNHTLSLLPSQIRTIDVLEDQFDPADFVTWPPQWFVSRDWGRFS